MEHEDIIVKLSQYLSPKRLQHSIDVSRTAEFLAKRYDWDVNQARLAGILHDCAREIPRDQLWLKAQKLGIAMDDEVVCSEPVLLHAPIGAVLAQKEYGVTDQAVLEAIISHTTGGKGMTLLAKIIYLADVIEPGRSFPGVDELRNVADRDLNQALLIAYDQSIKFILAKHGLIHPDTIDGRNELLLTYKT